MENYFVYILKSDLGYSYIGQTNNLEDRIKRHNANKNKYTKNKGKWELVISKEVKSRTEAVNFEKKLKNMKNVNKAIRYLSQLVIASRQKSGGS